MLCYISNTVKNINLCNYGYNYDNNNNNTNICIAAIYTQKSMPFNNL